MQIPRSLLESNRWQRPLETSAICTQARALEQFLQIYTTWIEQVTEARGKFCNVLWTVIIWSTFALGSGYKTKFSRTKAFVRKNWIKSISLSYPKKFLITIFVRWYLQHVGTSTRAVLQNCCSEASSSSSYNSGYIVNPCKLDDNKSKFVKPFLN